MFITPNNLRSVAKYLDNSVDVQDRVIRVGTGTAAESLIIVPLAGVGELDPQVVVRLTVGFDLDFVTLDNDVRIGITDGTYYNWFVVRDTHISQVCYPHLGSHESNSASEGTSYYPGQVTFLFQPFYKYGSCYTGHDGGHVNVGTFNSAVDPTKGLSLQVTRDEPGEQYQIYYFLVEIL